MNVSVGIGSGVGWFPLGPREVYVPGYRYSRRYLNNINVSNTVIVNNTYITNVYNGRHRNFDYRYGRDPRAVTIVDRDRFRGGGNLDGHWSRADRNDLRRWHHDPRPPAIAPNRDSVFAARTLGRIPGGADHVVRQTFNQQNRNASTQRSSRIPFDAEQRAIEANGGRPIPRSQLRAGAVNNLAAPGRLQTRQDGDGPREQQWRADRERTNGAASTIDARAQERNDARRAREAAIDPRDQLRSSDRPSWTRRENQTPRGDAPAVNSLQQQPGNSATRSTERQQEQWRGNQWQDRIKRSTEQQREQARSRLSSGDAQPRQRYEQPREQPRVEQPRVQQPRYEQPRVQQPRAEQPRVEQPRPQPRQEQPSFNRGNQERATRPQASQNNGNNAGNSGRSRPESSGGRPGFRQQER
jgi:hypothetical protein